MCVLHDERFASGGVVSFGGGGGAGGGVVEDESDEEEEVVSLVFFTCSVSGLGLVGLELGAGAGWWKC